MSGCDSGYVAAAHPYYRFRDVTRYGNDNLYSRAGMMDLACAKANTSPSAVRCAKPVPA
jgi:hypothetical protein